MNIGKVLGILKTESPVEFVMKSGWVLCEVCNGNNVHGLRWIVKKGTKRAGIKRAQDGGYVLVEVEL